MTGIGNNNLGNSQILNSEKVKKENVAQTVDNLKKSAEIDGNSNVILVKEEGDEAVVTSVKLDSKLDLSSILVGKDGKMGDISGIIKFFDNGEDDEKVFEMKKLEAGQAKPTQNTAPNTSTQTTPVQSTPPANPTESIYDMSVDQAFKAVSAMKVIGENFESYKEYPEDMKKDLQKARKDYTQREKMDLIKVVQEDSKIKADGKWGTGTFLKVKDAYSEAFNKSKLTDKEFRKVLDDFVKFYDGAISYENLNKKYKFGTYE